MKEKIWKNKLFPLLSKMDRYGEGEGEGGGEEEEEEEEAEGRDKHRVPGIRDRVRSRHVGASGPKSRQALMAGRTKFHI